MTFTEQDMIEQEKAFIALQDEFARITAEFEATQRELDRIGELVPLNAEMEAELEEMAAAAKDEALRAGAARAAQGQLQSATKHSAPGRGRAGIIRL